METQTRRKTKDTKAKTTVNAVPTGFYYLYYKTKDLFGNDVIIPSSAVINNDYHGHLLLESFIRFKDYKIPKTELLKKMTQEQIDKFIQAGYLHLKPAKSKTLVKY
jgi:hypothetical protein